MISPKWWTVRLAGNEASQFMSKYNSAWEEAQYLPEMILFSRGDGAATVFVGTDGGLDDVADLFQSLGGIGGRPESFDGFREEFCQPEAREWIRSGRDFPLPL